jgi:hypothetical protein
MDSRVFKSFIKEALKQQMVDDVPLSYFITKMAMSKKFPKLSSPGNWSNAVELAGLGTLAAPAASGLMGHHWSEKNKDRTEVAGLGMLAAPYAHNAIAKRAPSYANSGIGRKLTSAFGHV